MKNHAFIVIAHDDPDFLQILLAKLAADWAYFFVHIDKKSDVRQFDALKQMERVFFVEDRVNVRWGGWSQVQATLNSLSAARGTGISFSYFTLMSGNHYPLRPVDQIHAYVENNQQEYINIVKVPHEKLNKRIDRFDRFYFENLLRPKGRLRRVKSAINLAVTSVKLHDPAKMLPGWTLYAGSQWWTLSDAAISAVEKSIESEPRLRTFFRYVFCPDESFFQTILGNSGFLDKASRGNVYTDWSDPKNAPCYITERHLPELLSEAFRLGGDYGTGPAFYARKFGSKNIDVAREIDRFHLGG